MSVSPIGGSLVSGFTPALQQPQTNMQTDFASAISKAAFETFNTIKASESTAMDGIAGRAGIQDVVDSVLAAERSFSTALAVRDKIVTAYLELSRMPI